MISNLEYYRTFLYVADLQSFTKAANALYVSQSAVSQAVRKLEKELGYPLFERIGRTVQLTKEGNLLLGYVRRAMEELGAGENTAARLYQTRTRELTVGATETSIRYFLAARIRDFQKNSPDIHITFQGATTQELCRMLQEKEIDLAFLISPIPGGYDFHMLPLYEFQDIPVASGDMRIDREKEYKQRELSDYPMIAVSSENQVRINVEEWFIRDGVIPIPAYTVRSMGLILPLVRNGLGYGILPEEFVHDDLKQGTLFQIRTATLPRKRTLYAAIRKNEQLSVTAQAFLDAVPIQR